MYSSSFLKFYIIIDCCENIYCRYCIQNSFPLSSLEESSLFYDVYNKQTRRRFLVSADLIICLPPEKPRDIDFIPAVLKRVQRWRVSWISNDNRTEWSPIRSVVIRVINKIWRPRSGSPICLITSMITDRIGRHDVLLRINHNLKFLKKGSFLNQNSRNSNFFCQQWKKEPVKGARDGVYCPMKLSH